MIQPLKAIRSSAAAGALALALFACGGDSTAPSAAARIVFLTPSVSVALHAHLTLEPIVLDADNDNITNKVSVAWTSSDPSIASVDGAGVVTTSKLGGPIQLTATAGGVSGSVSLLVIPGRIVITPGVTQLLIGAAVQLSALVEDYLGVPIDAGPLTWTNDAPEVASFDANTRTLTGLSAGTAAVRVSAAGASSALPVLVGTPSIYDGLFNSAAGAATTASIEVVFGRVIRFVIVARPNPACALTFTASATAAINENGQFTFSTGPGNNMNGTFSTPYTVNGSGQIQTSGAPQCSPTGSTGTVGVLANYAASRPQ